MITIEQYKQAINKMDEKEVHRLTAAVNELAFFHLVQLDIMPKNYVDLSMADLPALLKCLVTKIESKHVS